MAEWPKDVPDVESPEFRAFLFTNMLVMQEHLNKAEALVRLLQDERTPRNMAASPQLWVNVAEAADSVKAIVVHLRGTFEVAGDFMDNPVAVNAVKEHVLSKMKDDGETRG